MEADNTAVVQTGWGTGGWCRGSTLPASQILRAAIGQAKYEMATNILALISVESYGRNSFGGGSKRHVLGLKLKAKIQTNKTLINP